MAFGLCDYCGKSLVHYSHEGCTPAGEDDPTPAVEHHHVTIDYGRDGYAPTTRLTCSAPEESLCRVVYGCGCEAYYDPRIDSGVASHADEQGERHYGVFSDCQLVEWFDNSDEMMRGAVTVPVRVEWNDGYEFILGGAS